MKLTKEFAEIIGMFAADGCLQKDYICMWGNIKEDKDYYDKVVCPLFSKVFNRKVIAHEKRSNSVYGFYICSKKIVEIFKNLGFTNNKTYNVEVPKEILNSENKKIIGAFIRGFTDCDGCLYFQRRKGKYKEFHLKYHSYPKIEIKVVSKNIIRDISILLNKLNIAHSTYTYYSKNIKWKDQQTLVIRGNIRLEKYIQKIGFNNYAKITKYEIWKKYGMCPTYTTINQRELILKDKLNPFSLYKVDQTGFEPATPSLEG